MHTYHYTYIVINSQPQSNQKYYIGVRTSSTPPDSDSSYMGSSRQLKQLIKEAPDKFQKEILQIWPTRNLAEAHEERLHGLYNVATNPLYYNKRNANAQFHTTPESNAKISKTMSSPDWVNTTGKLRTAKMMQTRNATDYIPTKNRAAKKRKETIASDEWKETIGAMQIQHQKETKSDPNWIKAHTFICPHCQKSIIGKANFNRWHASNCKKYTTI